ncbi:hypothetical protein FOVSG1_002870 [Fusarium oxysporum f. sp. vasinfectum]
MSEISSDISYFSVHDVILISFWIFPTTRVWNRDPGAALPRCGLLSSRLHQIQESQISCVRIIVAVAGNKQWMSQRLQRESQRQ